MTPFAAAVPAPLRSSPFGLFARVGPALAAAALLAACAQPGTPTSGAHPPHSVQTPSQPSVTPPSPATATADLPRALPAYHWDLAAVRDARGQNDARWRLPDRAPLRLNFKDGQLGAQNLCNVVGARYRLDGEQLRIDRAISTMRACSEPGLMALEQRVAQLLPTAQTAQVRAATAPAGASGQAPGGTADAAPQLTITFADGSQWELAGHPTPETRYGTAGERLFLEVAPEKVACNHPLMRNAMCLRVRDVHYDSQGVKTRSGDWRIFQGEIEGYQHQRGVRNIVRVNRYPFGGQGPQPADAPSHAYVLDMVVESEVVR